MTTILQCYPHALYPYQIHRESPRMNQTFHSHTRQWESRYHPMTRNEKKPGNTSPILNTPTHNNIIGPKIQNQGPSPVPSTGPKKRNHTIETSKHPSTLSRPHSITRSTLSLQRESQNPNSALFLKCTCLRNTFRQYTATRHYDQSHMTRVMTCHHSRLQTYKQRVYSIDSR